MPATTATLPAAAPRRRGAAFSPDPRDAWSDKVRAASRRGVRPRFVLSPLRIAAAIAAVIAAFATGAFIAFLVDYWSTMGGLPRETVNFVVDRIIFAESRGDPNAKNPRSSATGAGQFIDATWIELIRKHRADLSSRPQTELLDLRRDPKLAREMTTRFVETNAAKLRAKGLPITPGTLYLSHFAGGAGAIAILSADEAEDAAKVMAFADSTGRTSRDALLKANPFLAGMNAGALRKWADRKMRHHRGL